MTNTSPPDDYPPAWMPYTVTLIRRLSESVDSEAVAPIEVWDGDSGGTRSSRTERNIVTTHAGRLLMLIRMAASFGPEERFQDRLLRPGGVTMWVGIKPRELSLIEYLLKHGVLPPDVQVYTRSPHRPSGPVLQLCKPDSQNTGEVSKAQQAAFENRISEALPLSAPILILLPDGLELSEPLQRILPDAERLAPINRIIMLVLICELYNVSDAPEREAVLRLLPDDAALAQLDHPSIVMALRASSAREAAHALQKMVLPARSMRQNGLTLEEIGGSSPAHRMAGDLAVDIQACKAGAACWSEVPRSLLLYGEPGTGKTVLAQAIARSADVEIVIASAGEWQSRGHLGDMLGAMLKTFSDAAARRPCIVFLDEIDSFGARDAKDSERNSNYRRQVINTLLREIDKFLALDGTILVGACNAVDTLDPAIIRPGRFDQIVELTRPPLAQIAHMLRQVFPGAADVTPLARLCAGRTPAEIDATLRAARAAARRDGVPFDADLFAAQLGGGRPNHPAFERRIALHEAGHTLVAARLLGAAAVERVVMSAEMGQTFSRSAIREGTAQDFEIELTILLAGRAAERLVLGDVGAGSGGGPGSDLERATRLQLFFDRQAGLGIHGPAWLGAPDPARLPEAEQARLRAKLLQFEQQAQDLLAPYRELLVRLSEALLLQREMTAEELMPWLGQISDRG
ncbi:cell division protein FtsH (plasmid) [Alloyangia pacifica]|uniref:Cell division protein FtsH n=1 Tax=Alloyangia pacifica TaxID=311180 RepID=A0A2U8HLN3_9RHOB|nr:AAA family ATPase [Alloyangia pacifica]AWI86698.1 cell division protein FtsH [Alloyangia pacifica]